MAELQQKSAKNRVLWLPVLRGGGVLALVLLPVVGCAVEGTDEGLESARPLARPTGELVIPDGCGHQLRIGTEPFSMALETTAGVVVSRLATDGLRIGAVGSLDPSYNYDPYYFYQNLFVPAKDGPKGLQWLPVSKVSGSYASGNEQVLSVALSNNAPATLRVSASCPSAFTFFLEAPTLATAYVGVDFEAPSAERYYGLGEQFDGVEHRGKLKAMQLAVDLKNGDYYNHQHVPVPLIISTAGWGALVTDYHPGVVDVAKTQASKVRFEFGSRNLTFHWMAASKPLALVSTYTGLTGTPAVPPVWAFAPVFWRDEVSGQAMVLEDAEAIRSNHITGSGVWLDRPYESYITSMDFDPTKYPDPAAMVSELHAKGFRLAGWNVPYLDPNDPDYEFARQQGYFIKGYTTQMKWGPMIDFTNPEAMAFWQDRVRGARALGFEGWKMDYGEDILNGIGSVALHLGFDNGEDCDTMHHQYSNYYHRAYLEPYDGLDTFIISRTGTWGGQQYTSVIWPGDLNTDYTYFSEEHHTGGFPAAVAGGLSLAASGYPFYASDTGGYKPERPEGPTSELLLRWTQYSAFLPIMQYGGCGDADASCNPWDFTEMGATTFTQETLDVFRTYSQLHTQLFPLFYRLAEKARANGEPPVRPFGLYWPQDGRHPMDELVVGDALLVAPLTRGGTSREVLLPAGNFVDYWTGAKVKGPATLNLSVPLAQVPLYFLEGAIVPMLRPTVETLDAVSVSGIDSFASDAGRVWGYVVPGATQTRGELPYDGGAFTTQGGAPITLSFTPSAGGTRFTGVNLRVYAPGATSVVRDGSVSFRQVNVGETATCTDCYARETGSPWLWVGLNNLKAWTLRVQ